MFADGQTNVHCCPGVNTFLSTSKRAKQWSGSNEAHYLVTLNRFFWQKRLLNVQQELSVAFTGTLIARWWRQMEVLYFWSKQATVACIQRRVHIDEKQSLVWNTVLRAMQTCKAAALWEGPDVIKWLVKNLMFTFLVINRFCELQCARLFHLRQRRQANRQVLRQVFPVDLLRALKLHNSLFAREGLTNF